MFSLLRRSGYCSTMTRRRARALSIWFAAAFFCSGVFAPA
jgi:hypothetical protein